jgi:hypothetical protein
MRLQGLRPEGTPAAVAGQRADATRRAILPPRSWAVVVIDGQRPDVGVTAKARRCPYIALGEIEHRR